jgi:1,4-dihydroxy-2-naphthoyl-CoA hydrolase
MGKDEKDIWFEKPTKEDFDKRIQFTSMEHNGIEFIEAGPDYIKGRMPVDRRTHQPFGLLHGGMSVMLAETFASWGAAATVDHSRFSVVGQEINANHVRAVSKGWVYATARPIHIGRASQVWEVRIENEGGKLTCIARMTAAILNVKDKDRRQKNG